MAKNQEKNCSYCPKNKVIKAADYFCENHFCIYLTTLFNFVNCADCCAKFGCCEFLCMILRLPSIICKIYSRNLLFRQCKLVNCK